MITMRKLNFSDNILRRVLFVFLDIISTLEERILMADYEDERHVEKTTFPLVAGPAHRESNNTKSKSRVEKRTGIVLSCSERRIANRRRNNGEGDPEKNNVNKKGGSE